MWSKLITGLLLLLCNQAIYAQEWLHKTEKEILRHVTENKRNMQSDTLLTMTCQEEDELGRLFEISYRIHLKDKVCVSYERLLPIHRYWAETLLEQAHMQEAEASGEEVYIEGVTLNTLYSFDDYRIHISIKDNLLLLLYTPPI